MDPTRLEDLLADPQAQVRLRARGMTVRALAAWVVAGEDHLSYTTLTRLVECCREHHWAQDVLPAAEGEAIDAIARGFSATFDQSVRIGALIALEYQVCAVRSRGYQLRFVILDGEREAVYARYTLDCVFYDPIAHRACRAAPQVIQRLSALAASNPVDR